MLDYADKKIAIIIWNTEKEDDAHVYLGIIELIDGEFFFRNKAKGWNIQLDDEKLERLKPVTEDIKSTLLGADLFFSFSMSGIPDDSTDEFIFTGIKWH
jgi:hypothetical protein